MKSLSDNKDSFFDGISKPISNFFFVHIQPADVILDGRQCLFTGQSCTSEIPTRKEFFCLGYKRKVKSISREKSSR